MSTLLQRQQLTSAHITALTQLSRRYTRELSVFMNVASRTRTDELGPLIFNTLPQLLTPFQNASVSIAERFANMRAEQSGIARFPEPQSLPLFSDMMRERRLASAGLAESLIMQKREGYSISNMNILKALDRPVVDSDRDTITYLSNVSPEVSSTVVAVRGDGCAFCKMLGVRSVKGTRERANFHNFCRCVFDPQIRGEEAFKQPYYNEFEEDYEKAKQLIESGEAGERVLSVGSKQWQTSTRRDLQAHLRAQTSTLGEYEGTAKQAASQARRQATELTDSIMQKTLTGESLSPRELQMLGDSYDVSKLSQPLHTPWKSTTRDIAKFMESQRSKDAYQLNKLGL